MCECARATFLAGGRAFFFLRLYTPAIVFTKYANPEVRKKQQLKVFLHMRHVFSANAT